MQRKFAWTVTWMGCAISLQASTVFVREKAGTIWQDGLLIGNGATAATPMPGLSGLFYGPLDGGVTYNCYVHDQNVQIPMMPFFPLGQADFIEPFVKTYEQALPELERRAARQAP